jgi:hypothetical protein
VAEAEAKFEAETEAEAPVSVKSSKFAHFPQILYYLS